MMPACVPGQGGDGVGSGLDLSDGIAPGGRPLGFGDFTCFQCLIGGADEREAPRAGAGRRSRWRGEEAGGGERQGRGFHLA